MSLPQIRWDFLTSQTTSLLHVPFSNRGSQLAPWTGRGCVCVMGETSMLHPCLFLLLRSNPSSSSCRWFLLFLHSHPVSFPGWSGDSVLLKVPESLLSYMPQP